MSADGDKGPSLSPEDEEHGRAAIERMLKRHREGRYRTNPPVPAKLKSMAPGMRVVKNVDNPPSSNAATDQEPGHESTNG